ncbi:DUF87 domain-containing protein [Alicyclobacillus tolerans]|uniref:FtsK/SpoIIIE domain-containing protein n=1 Tax=Alicyclobacillus tolerans TaxID=90970 RepID=UPI001F3A5F6F|nr:FtsK/SpoIIIE domain-containing protein [Alicyclobacillus tolerans]MCF8568385.1 DUF87 domain-containing protein [Alicyclobacillus tolerans]
MSQPNKPTETDTITQVLDALLVMLRQMFWYLGRHLKRHPWIFLVSCAAIPIFLLPGHWHPTPHSLKGWEHILPTWSWIAIAGVLVANMGWISIDEQAYIPSSNLDFENALKQAGLWDHPKYRTPQVVLKKEHKNWLEWSITPTVPVDVWTKSDIMHPFCAALGVEKFSRVFRDKHNYIHLVLSRSHFPEQVMSSALLGPLSPRSLALGMSLEGICTVNLDERPHLLIAGQTGSGKSVLVHHIIEQLIRKNWHVQLVDPKGGVDYADLESYLSGEIVSHAEQALPMIESLWELHQERLPRLKQWRVTKWGDALNMGLTDEPDHVLIIDEFAIFANDAKDKAKKELAARAQNLVQNLALGARATGIHLVICTQYPTSDLLGNQLRQQLVPIAGYLESDVASRTVLGEPGAEQLPGQGRFLIRQPQGLVEFQGFLPRV